MDRLLASVPILERYRAKYALALEECHLSSWPGVDKTLSHPRKGYELEYRAIVDRVSTPLRAKALPRPALSNKTALRGNA